MEEDEESLSMEVMVASLFREEEGDDDEVRELQAVIQRLAIKAQHYSSHGPALVSARLQNYLQLRRPTLPLEGPLGDGDVQQDVEGSEPNSDDAIAQAKLLKDQIAALKEEIPALLQRMKSCLEACEKKQKVSEECKRPLPGFLQEVHSVWKSLSPFRTTRTS